MPRKQPELVHKIISTYAEDTPENRARFKNGIRLLNDIIDEIELRNRQTKKDKEAS